MAFDDPPRSAAWRHHTARDGFEVVFFRAGRDGYGIQGHTTAVEDGHVWAVQYVIRLDPTWVTRRVRVVAHGEPGTRTIDLAADAAGWSIDGERAAHLDGCVDVDLESSALTNAFPVRRLDLAVGQGADAPAAYVRALDLRVERLDQRYRRRPDRLGDPCFDYSAPRFSVNRELVYDACGLVLDYPGLAARVS